MSRHIAALEADVVILEALLASLIWAPRFLDVSNDDRATNEDPEGKVIVVLKIVKVIQFSECSFYFPPLVLSFLLSFIFELFMNTLLFKFADAII